MSERDYRNAAAYITSLDSSLTCLLQHYASQRAQFATQLQIERHWLGYTAHQYPRNQLAGNALSASTSDQHALFRECVRSDALAEEWHAHALQAALPLHIYELVRNQYMQIRGARHRIEEVRRQLPQV